jgi:hypothetical protein
VGYHTSIALDTSGNPHISYYTATNSDLKYAKWTGSSWSIQTVDSAGTVGLYTSIVLNTNGNPHISYYDYTNGDLKYARWTGSSWSIQTVDSAGSVGEFTSIALDTSGNPHISYRDETNYDLKYAKWVPNNAPTLTWTGETNYTSDGLNPETGDTSTTFVYRVKYTDADNDAPKSDYPKVHIKKGGVEITGSPFAMTYVSGSYNTGAIYSYSTTLPSGIDYSYYFEAYDVWNASATGIPTNSKTGPNVITTTVWVTNFSDTKIKIVPNETEIEIIIPPNTFSTNFNLSLTYRSMVVNDFPSNQSNIKVLPVGFDINTDRSVGTPQNDITITLKYRDSDIGSSNEENLKIAYYDTVTSRWVPIFTVSKDILNNKIVAKTRHFSTFALVEHTPSSEDIKDVYCYPVPLYLSKGQKLKFSPLPPEAEIEIYTINGLRVKKLTANSYGEVLPWDGRNESSGEFVSTGTYIVYVKDKQNNKKVFKIMVIR